MMNFPKDFLWGAATASYQIEGSKLEEGRGECIWYRYSHTPGNILNDDTGDIACDHLHRYEEDVALMQTIGLRAYRFSIAWARVLPQGTGTVNQQGLDFYDRLVDALLMADIKPAVTLYHWDLPQALQDKGGWETQQIVDWFCEYADIVTRKLGDRAKQWITLNEPWVVAFVGNFLGRHAPGKQDLRAAYRVAHHQMLAHGAAVAVIRQNVPQAEVGITLDITVAQPASDAEGDILAAQRQDGFKNRWFLDAVFKGRYPDDIVQYNAAALADIDMSEVARAAVPLDFLGVNYYTRNVWRYDPTGFLEGAIVPQEGSEHTAMGWEVYPDGLRQVLLRVHEGYSPKALYVTENGAAFDDPEPQGGMVEDPQRVRYLERHFAAAQQALEQGAPLKGYFVWSLMDNFEWGFGYSKRFGIIHIDYKTLTRTLKRSALFYRDVIRATREQ